MDDSTKPKKATAKDSSDKKSKTSKPANATSKTTAANNKIDSKEFAGERKTLSRTVGDLTPDTTAGKLKAYAPNLVKIGILVVILIVLVVIFRPKPINPTVAFDSMLGNSLSVQKAQVAEGTSSSTYDTNFDFTNSKNPVVTTNQVIRGQGLTETITSWGNLQNSYMMFNLSNSSQTVLNNAPPTNKWISLRVNGVVEPNVPTLYSEVGNPNFELVTPILFGNLTSSQRQNLLTASSGVYTFDTSKVSQANVSGQGALTYSVSINKTKLTSYTKLYAGYMGLNSAEVTQATASYANLPSTLGISINKTTDRLIQVTENANKTQTVVSYTYNTPTTPPEPTAQLTWAQYVQAITAK